MARFARAAQVGAGEATEGYLADAVDRVHVTLFVPGSLFDLSEWQKALGARGLALSRDVLSGGRLPFELDVEWVENPNDGSFGRAFSFGTASTEEQRSIDAAPGALVLSLPADLHRERSAITALARALASCGALAVRIEESKLGFPMARWLELIQGTNPWSLYRLAVVMLGESTDATTCGMQVFSLPDAHVELDEETNEVAANKLLDAFNVYQLAENPLLLSGHTFAPDAHTPKRLLRRWPDATYPSGDRCHNPFGVWRLGVKGASGSPPGALSFVFMPTLAAVLAAAEEQNRGPLTRKQVETLTSQAACIAMEPADAQRLERERGYADLDPVLAWEQWQIARRTD